MKEVWLDQRYKPWHGVGSRRGRSGVMWGRRREEVRVMVMWGVAGDGKGREKGGWLAGEEGG